MHRILCALMISASLAQPLAAQDAATIESTIQNQIRAFEADDFATAFSFASPNIKGLFGTAQNFGAMVQQGYPMVYRPSSLRMLGSRDDGGLLWQRVMVTDQAGAMHLLDYQMIQTSEGWRINAVQLLQLSGVGA